MPGVVEAIAPRSTSAASGTERVCTSRICRRAPPVGRLHDDAAVEAARAQQRLVEDLGPVRGRQDDHAAVEP